MKSIERRERRWEANKDDKESILIENYMANRLNKETLFGYLSLTMRSPENFICLDTVFSRFSVEQAKSLT